MVLSYGTFFCDLYVHVTPQPVCIPPPMVYQELNFECEVTPQSFSYPSCTLFLQSLNQRIEFKCYLVKISVDSTGN